MITTRFLTVPGTLCHDFHSSSLSTPTASRILLSCSSLSDCLCMSGSRVGPLRLCGLGEGVVNTSALSPTAHICRNVRCLIFPSHARHTPDLSGASVPLPAYVCLFLPRLLVIRLPGVVQVPQKHGFAPLSGGFPRVVALGRALLGERTHEVFHTWDPLVAGRWFRNFSRSSFASWRRNSIF